MRLLLPESVTRLEPYLRRRDAEASLEAHRHLALVLLLREEEFLALHVHHGPTGARIDLPPDPDPWEPHPLTPEARARLERELAGGDDPTQPAEPHDLFGLKDDVADGLEGALRASAEPRFEELPLLFRLWRDLHRYESVVRAARAWTQRAPDDPTPWAYLYESVLLMEEDPEGRWLEAATEAEVRGRRLARGRGEVPDVPYAWSARLIERLDEGLTDRAHGVRRTLEPGFERFFTTERAYNEELRHAAMAGFDEATVPEALRALIPLARRYGVGDDPSRTYFIARTAKAERVQAAEAIRRAGAEIDGWLSQFDVEGELPPAVRAFYWLREAGEEMAP